MATTQKVPAATGMSGLSETVREETGKAKEMLKDATSYVGKKAEDATSAMGGGMESLAETIRDKGPHSGMFGKAGSAMADTLESSGRYLQQHGLSGMAEDIVNTVRRHPVPAILLAVGLGFLAARALRR